MDWRIAKGFMPGIYNVYDDEDNPVAVDCTKDRAMLIATAPELLEALKISESLLKRLRICNRDFEQEIDEVCEQAHAAIAKAKGE